MHEKKRLSVSAKPTEPLSEFVEEFAEAFPRLRPLAEVMQQWWYRMMRALGFSQPTPVKAPPPSYHAIPRPSPAATNERAVASSTIVAASAAVIHIQDALVADAGHILQQYAEYGVSHPTKKAKLNEAIVAFEKKYSHANLRDLSFDALVLYEQVMLIVLKREI